MRRPRALDACGSNSPASAITRGGVSFPGFKGVDCDMYMTQKVLPSKLDFRSGWEPGDLFTLVEWYAPRESTQLKVLPEQADKVQAESWVFPTRYSWEGEVAAGTTQQFVTVPLPHAPLREASPLAAGITALADRPGVAAVQVTQDTRCELAILNASGEALHLECKAGSPVSGNPFPS